MISMNGHATSTIPGGSLLQAALSLAAIYLSWIGASLLVLLVGRSPAASSGLVVPAAVVCFVVLASVGAAVFLIGLEPHLHGRRWLRVVLLLLTLAAGVGLYFLGRSPGGPGNLTFIFGSSNLLVFAALLGSWMVAPLTRPAEIVPVCVVMTAADLFSVLAGPTREIAFELRAFYEGGMEGPVPAAEFMLIKIAVPGFAALVPVFGVADWIMVVFLVAAVAKFRMNDNLAGPSLRTMLEKGRLRLYVPVAASGLILAVLLAQGLNLFLPALPVVSLVFLGYILLRYPQTRALKYSDWVAILLVSGVASGLAVIRFEGF
jgi:hypothetical protein